MEKKYIVGGLALLGAIGVVAYLNKPKRNSEGFFGANGRMGRSAGGCRVCQGSGVSNYFANNGVCQRGDKCLQSVQDFSQG
jgi:hypothetical protein